MPLTSRRYPARCRGFSLLEMVVAITMLAVALGVIYQAASGATRNVRTDEGYAYGVELARTLLSIHARVPFSGVDERGKTAGDFSWRVRSRPLELQGQAFPKGSLHVIEVAVSWADGSRQREVVLNSIVEGIRP